jgi:hypothetical protein
MCSALFGHRESVIYQWYISLSYTVVARDVETAA